MSTEEEEIDTLNSTEENLLDDDVNENSLQEESDIDYFAQFSCPDDSDDDDDWVYFYDNFNDDVLLTDILNRHQLTELNNREENHYQRSKRSHKKINALRQIKTKHAQSIKINSHNKHLYIHHRIFKRIHLDPPSQNYLPSTSQVPTYCSADLRTIREQQQTKVSPTRPPAPVQPVIQFPQHTIQRSNIPNEACFDDAMVRFLLDMQNRDLCPEDYEMLLRLDERVQRKTVDKNILNTLPTIQVDQTHLNDQCTICMEEYTLGQSLKLLPCKHLFHTKCIETYLKEFSVQCPLDNLPLV